MPCESGQCNNCQCGTPVVEKSAATNQDSILDGGFKSRKLLFAFFSLCITTLLLVNGHISDDIWSEVAQISIIAYMVGNIGAKWSLSKGPK